MFGIFTGLSAAVKDDSYHGEGVRYMPRTLAFLQNGETKNSTVDANFCKVTLNGKTSDTPDSTPYTIDNLTAGDYVELSGVPATEIKAHSSAVAEAARHGFYVGNPKELTTPKTKITTAKTPPKTSAK